MALKKKYWDFNLGKLQWSLNNTINKGTGKCPAEIVFGQRTIVHSEGMIKGALEDSEQMTSVEREELRQTVQENIEENQLKIKTIMTKTKHPLKYFSRTILL